MKNLVLLTNSFLLLLAIGLGACRKSADPLDSSKTTPMIPRHSEARFFTLRLLPGHDLRQELRAFVNERHIQAGYIATCVGSLTKATLRFANQNQGTEMHGHFEILSLTGTISEQTMHLHMAIADSVGKTYGGHLVEENRIFTTAEIVIGELMDYSFSTELDTASGFNELKIRPAERN